MMSSPGFYAGMSPLATDLYQLTMAYGYWQRGAAEWPSVFHLTFRRSPFQGQYAIAAGLEPVASFLNDLRFSEDDLAYLRSLVGVDGKQLFADGFIDYLRDFEFRCDVDAMPEGTAVFPHEPLLRVTGPLLQAQLIETPLLTLINFQTLVATKSARVVESAQGDAVLEFGLRRAQGFDGGMSASRAAYIGGCAATSNVLAGKLFGIPVKGTHAHSWVLTFDDELESFRSYAQAMPNNTVFLVDTYDTLQGVRHAITVASEMREAGHEVIGVRLDSGDLSELSIQARRLLDESGFPDAAIVASNDLDEYRIQRLKREGARINVWGVGTRLSTAYDQPALGGVYKLSAIRERESDPWRMRVKLSEEAIKISNPGLHQVRRFESETGFASDMIYDITLGCPAEGSYVDNGDLSEYRYESHTPYVDLLQPIFRDGKLITEFPPLTEVRERSIRQTQKIPENVRRIDRPASYSVGLERRLFDCKSQLITIAEGVEA